MSIITVIIPTIPGREALLGRAVASVHRQTHLPLDLIIEKDPGFTGAAATRNRALQEVSTDWVAFLDDDDEMLPHHILTLYQAAMVHGADYVFGDFTVPENPGFRLASYNYGPWKPANPLQTTITVLVRTAVMADMNGFEPSPPELTLPGGDHAGEDFYLTYRINAAGYRIHHVPEITWLWHHHGRNTSGRGHVRS